MPSSRIRLYTDICSGCNAVTLSNVFSRVASVCPGIADIRDVKKYIELNGDIGKLHENIEILTKEDAMEEFMFLGLRKVAGVDVKDFQNRFGVSINDVYAKETEQNINKGLLVKQADMLRLTEYGMDICNTVMSDFILTDGD